MKFLPMKQILLKLCNEDEVYDKEYYEENIISLDINGTVNTIGSVGQFGVFKL
jgi:hypothetical protein